jgi:hypothetical protein
MSISVPFSVPLKIWSATNAWLIFLLRGGHSVGHFQT